MSGYEEDHNLEAFHNSRPRQPRSGRPDYSSFYNSLAMTDTENTHTEPLPQDVSAVFRLLANTLQIQLGESEGVATETPNRPAGPENQERLENMIEQLMAQADAPPRQVTGMPDEWFDRELERVDKKKLKADDVCALCFVPHLDDKYPLVVRLPCHEKHIFDLECIRPWLKTHTTCPFCRLELGKKKQVVVPKEHDDEDEFDGLYA